MRPMLLSRRVACLTLCLALADPLVAKELVADATTQLLLKPAEFEQVVISPDGTLLAIARHSNDGSIVTLHRRDTMAAVTQIDPGKSGVITTLEWLEDGRLMVGANRLVETYGLPWSDPSLYIVQPDGRDTFKLPGNFIATIKGDPDHLLVSACVKYEDGDCVLDIRRADIRHLRRLGDLVIRAPAGDTGIGADQFGNIRFAYGQEDDGTSKAYLHLDGKDDWTLVNDSAKTGLDVMPFGVGPDGSYALLQSERKDGTDVIETYTFATGARAELLRDPDSDPLGRITSFDGKDYIGAYFSATRPRARFWNEQHPDARALKDLAAAFPGKNVSVTSTTANGSLAVLFVSSDRDPGTFLLFDRKARKVNPIARAMPWIDAAALGTQSEVQFKARDGLPLHGLLTLPPGGNASRLPLVVLPHGGPYDVVDAWGYDPEGQILATHGYAVLQVNFRGSDGYGRTFADAGVMQWGRAMQDDVTDATRWAIEQGIADPKRICIFGASYGGYAALMGVAREPGLYRCAVGLSGVYDLSKMYRWGSIKRSDYGKNYLKRVIGEDQAELAARSPVDLAAKITVPVLLAHGRADDRVDIKHARRMQSALQKSGNEAELLEYPYTGHSIVLDGYLRDFYAHLLAFLDENLQGK